MSRAPTNAVDLLEAEDRAVLALLERIEHSSGQGVEARARYGDLVKRLVRQLGYREAAVVAVTRGLERAGRLGQLAGRLSGDAVERRRQIDKVERLSRGVQSVDLRTGQEFAPALDQLAELLTEQVRWELSTAVPAIRQTLSRAEQDDLFRSARYLRRHAPTNLDPSGPRWYERAPVISRLLTVVDHLRDFPYAARRAR